MWTGQTAENTDVWRVTTLEMIPPMHPQWMFSVSNWSKPENAVVLVEKHFLPFAGFGTQLDSEA